MSPQTEEADQPLALFIDTSVIINQNFDFDGRLLRAVITRVEAGDVELLMPEVTRREIKANLAKRIVEAERQLARLRLNAHTLSTLPENPLAALFEEIDWTAIHTRAQQCLDHYLQRSRAVDLPIADRDGAAVLDDYFGDKAPFGRTKKRSEFPDSFAAKALSRFAARANRRVAVVSLDGDWRAICDSCEMLEWFDTLEEALEHSIERRPLSPEIVRPLLERHTDAIMTEINERFRELGFYLETEEGYVGEVDETFDEQVDYLAWSIIDQDREWVEVAGHADVYFGAQVTYPDPDMTAWDSEDKELVVLGYEHASIRASEHVPVTWRVNLTKLRNGELEIADLVVNRNESILIDRYEIEETYSSADEEPDIHDDEHAGGPANAEF